MVELKGRNYKFMALTHIPKGCGRVERVEQARLKRTLRQEHKGVADAHAKAKPLINRANPYQHTDMMKEYISIYAYTYILHALSGK